MQKVFLPLADAGADQIKSLRVANVRVVLIAVTVPPHQLESLKGALDALTTRSDIVGTLDDGSMGILCFLPVGTDLGNEMSGRFVPRLRLHMLERTNGQISPVSIRAVDRMTSELSDVSDLTDALLGAHDFAIDLTVRQPLGISFAPLFHEPYRDIVYGT